jgi:hypothetical protein
MTTPFQSEHFSLHTLAEGVYAAIATEGGAGFSNAGLVAALGELTGYAGLPEAASVLGEKLRVENGLETAISLIDETFNIVQSMPPG